VSDANRIFADTTFNGDGILIPESATDDATRAVISDIIACLGGILPRHLLWDGSLHSP